MIPTARVLSKWLDPLLMAARCLTLDPSCSTSQAAEMYYRTARLRFECTGCGACCVGDPDHVVEASARECDSIREFLGLSEPWFRRRYLIALDADTTGIKLGEDGRCPFLGADRRCRIYPVRPTQCRTYPWWPEVIADRLSWAAEAKRCEGINCGAEVPLARIERALRRERNK